MNDETNQVGTTHASDQPRQTPTKVNGHDLDITEEFLRKEKEAREKAPTVEPLPLP